jgi:hypothetical protein
MQVCEQGAVAARLPPEEIKQRGLFLSALRSANGRIRRGGLPNMPGRPAAFVEAQDALGCFIDVNVAKIFRCFRPASCPALGRDQSTLMHSVPTLHSDFDGQKPGERSK